MDNRHKLLVALGAGALVLMALMGYLIWSGYQEAIRVAEITTRNYAAILEARLDATLRRADADLQDLVRTIPIVALNRRAVSRYAPDMHEQLSSRTVNFPELAGLRVTDADGERLYTSADADTPPSNLADRSYFRLLRDNPGTGLVFSEVLSSRSLGRPSMVAARALRDSQGSFRGIVFATMELEYFQNLFQTMDVGPHGFIDIIRSDDFRVVVRHPAFAGSINRAIPPESQARMAIAAGKREATLQIPSPLTGDDYVLSFRVLEHYPFYVLAAAQRADVLAGWKERSLAVAVSGLLLLGLLAGLLNRLARAETQRVRVKADLAKNEERARHRDQHVSALFDAMPIAIGHADTTERITFANRVYRTIYSGGSDPTGRTIRDVVGEEIYAITGPLIKRALAGEEIQFDRSFVGDDGLPHARWLRYVPDLDPAGEIVGFFALIQDISERKQAEEALCLSEIRFRSIYENVQDVYIESTIDGTILEVSPQIQTLLKGQYTRDEMVGMSALDFYADPRRREAWLRALKETGSLTDFEIEFKNRDGSLVPVSVSAKLLLDRDGHPHRLVATLRDITERKQMEESLLQGEVNLRRFRAAMDATSDAIYLVDRASMRFIDVNEAACRMQSRTREELLALGPVGLLSLPREELERTYDSVIAGGRGVETVEMLRPRKGGTHAWVEIRRHAQRFGESWMIVTVVRDITERKQAEAAHAALEAQLRESQKMEAIGTLAGGIAHDFNNIIATILGNTELALEDVSTNPRARESIEEIRKAGRRGRDVVQQILAFSRRQPTERALTVLTPIVEQTVLLLRATLPARIALEVHCDADVPPVLADATQIQQILINLATNAMQAMQGKPGRIDIRLDTVMIDTALTDKHPELSALHDQHPGRTVRLAVSDDAAGMDAATLGKIFEPFFTTKPAGEGTGLGLSVVHGIVQTHEGAIVVDSAPGKGTTFTIYLPVAKAQAGAPAPAVSAPTAAPARDSDKHILYLDDDEALVRLVERLLERRGYRVSGYINQQEALAALRTDPASFDLVVTDYNMPGMSGLDVAREVRLIRTDLPVAVISGFIDEALRMNANAAGVQELILKADAMEDLCEAFARLAQTVGAKSKSS
jgi:PAS domain S-box-containing protein